MTGSHLQLSGLCAIITRQLAVAALREVWVVAELSDLRVSGGHCYMELIEKNATSGQTVARLRGIIWAGTFARIHSDFFAATGQQLSSGMKVLVRGSVNNHAAYGLSFVISAIDASFTLGEAERRRREILERLKADGVLELNRTIGWPAVPWRIAVISAKGAAGYGDFMHQLANNASHLRFHTHLFEAVLQGDRTAPTVIDALNRINSQLDNWDCVVIIRGGGATSDLAAFDNYELALNVAQFPIPVIVGIGHERDVTVLDYVANMRVKTPTAAAEWLIARGNDALAHLRSLADDIARAAADITAGADKRLAYAESLLAVAPVTALQQSASTLQRCSMALAETGARRITPALERLKIIQDSLPSALATRLNRESERLDSRESLLDVLSPVATLKRGYTITRINGAAVTSAQNLPQGSQLQTIFADGSINSITI